MSEKNSQENTENRNKPSLYKKNKKFSDGAILKKKLFFNDTLHYVIFLNQHGEVQYKAKSTESNKIGELENIGVVITELQLVPRFLKKDLNLFLAKIYDFALSGEINKTKGSSGFLLEKIQARKKILKKLIYLINPIFFTIIFYLAYFGGIKNYPLVEKYKYLPLFSAIGNYISVAHRINKIEFNSHETPRFYFFFSFFKYITSLVSSLMLIIFYDSKIINIQLGTTETNYTNTIVPLLSAIGGYAEVLVPNIFESISKKIQTENSN